jgi:hypothetical protein
MKISKKILLIITSFSIISVFSGAIAYGLNAIYNIPFWAVFWIANSLQIAWSIYRDQYLEGRKITNAITEYSKKPYKKYYIPLNCAHCGHKNEIEIDLTDTEFRCENCKKFNGIHTNFMTAAITEPIINPEL